MRQGFERASSGPTTLVTLVGVLLAAATIHTGATATSFATMLEAALLTILTVAVLGRAITLYASDRSERDNWRVAGWCFVGTLAGSLLAGVVLMRIALRGDPIAAPLVLVELFAGVGAVAGLFVGGDQVRAIAAGRSSERQQTSELLEKREAERLTFLNNLLRHNVLNGMNIVLGYASALENQVEDSEYVDRIRTRSEAIVELVQNVQVLVRSLSGDLTIDAVNLTDAARAQLERARKNHDATFSVDLEPDVTVASTPYISAAIENLLTNAIVHNDSPDPEVALTVERRGDDGIVTITDNGPGIPEDVIDTYFGDHRPSDEFVGDGLGLYLVDELVTTHGGTIDIDTSDDGTTITLAFPLTAEQATSTAETDDSSDPVAA